MVRSEGKAAEGRRHDSLQARKQRLQTSVSHVPEEQDKSRGAGSARGESSGGKHWRRRGQETRLGPEGSLGNGAFGCPIWFPPRKWGGFGPIWVRLGGICYVSLENFCPPWCRHCGFAAPGAKRGARRLLPSSPSRNLEEGHVKQTPPCRALLTMLSPMTSSLASRAR